MNNPFDFKGCQFASFTYTNSYGEVSNYHVLLGTSYETLTEKDFEKLNNASFEENHLEIARLNLVNAKLKNMNEKTKSNQSKAQANAYTSLEKGFKIHNENQTVHLMARCLNKTQTEEQIKQTEINFAIAEEDAKNKVKPPRFKVKTKTNSRQKTIDQNNVKKLLGLDELQIVNFKFVEGRLQRAKVNGQVIEM